MKSSECLSFAGRPDRIGGLAPALCFDGATINRTDDIKAGISTTRPGTPAQSWDEAVISDLLANHPGASNLILVNMEGLASTTYLQSESMIDKGMGELAAWLKMVNRLKQLGARVALDLATVTPWTLGETWKMRRPDAERAWSKMRMIGARLRADVLPLVDAVCAQMYYTLRWGDARDFNGEAPIYGNFSMWQTTACALAALTDKPAIAYFSPLAMSVNPSIPTRPMTDDELGKSMFYLSGMGFSEMCWWGSVDQGTKTAGGWNKWDGKADWVARMLKYWDAKGEFVPDARWQYV